MIEHQIDARRARNRLSSRDLALVASFAALIAVLGFPGWRRGALSVIVFLVLVATGLPLLAGGRGGIAVFFGPSAGYLFGYIVGAAAIGWLVEQRLPAYPIWWGGLANVMGGMGAIYLLGVPVLAWVTHISLQAAAILAYPFLPGDLFKAVVGTAVASAVHRAYPGITAGRAARKETVSAR